MGCSPRRIGTNGSGHDAIPVQIAAAVEVAAARDAHRQAVGLSVGLRNQIGAGLADVVGMAAFERRVLAVGELFLVAIGLVGGGDHDGADARRAPARLEQVPRALNVAFECRDGIAIGDSDDGLRRQMNDRRGFVFADGPFQQVAIADIAAHDFDAVDDAASAPTHFAAPNRAPGRPHPRRLPAGGGSARLPPDRSRR